MHNHGRLDKKKVDDIFEKPGRISKTPMHYEEE